MRYIVRIASYDDATRKRPSICNMLARDYQDAVDIKDALDSGTESRNAVICVRLYTRAGPVLLNVDEFQSFAGELSDAINEAKTDSKPKFKTA